MTASSPLALVTGASSGIGKEIAQLFAEDGFDLIVVADGEGIAAVATDLARRGIDARPVQADLSTDSGVRSAFAAVEADGRRLHAAALNAGIGRGGSFLDIPLADTLAVIDTDVRGTVHLAKLVLESMNNGGAGRILFTSSVASTMPGPFQAVYNASKAFVQSFAEALENELKDSAVTVTSLMPGPTETNFFHRARMDHTRMGRSNKDDASDVARQGYAALMKGDRRVVAASRASKAIAALASVTPNALKAAVHRFLAKPAPRTKSS
jgi:short-subunit dehydrogenase